MNGVQHKAVGVAWGAAAAYAAIHGQGDNLGIIYAFTAGIGAMLPDIDHDMTKLGRKRKLAVNISKKLIIIIGIVAFVVLAAGVIGLGINLEQYGFNRKLCLILLVVLIIAALVGKLALNSDTVKWCCKHRGFMHTLWPVLIILAFKFVSQAPIWCYIINGLAIGYMSHLIADALNKEGVPIAWPLTRANFRILSIPTKEVSMCWIACMIIMVIPIFVSLIFF